MNYSIPCLASTIMILFSSTYLTISEKWPTTLIFIIVVISLAMMWSIYLIVQSRCRARYFKYINKKNSTSKSIYVYPIITGIVCFITLMFCFSFSETAYNSWPIVCAFVLVPVIIFTAMITWCYFDHLKKHLHFVIIDELKKSSSINSLEWFLGSEVNDDGVQVTTIICRCSDLSLNYFVQILKAALDRRNYRMKPDMRNCYSLYIRKFKKKTKWQRMSIEQTENDYEYRVSIE